MKDFQWIIQITAPKKATAERLKRMHLIIDYDNYWKICNLEKLLPVLTTSQWSDNHYLGTVKYHKCYVETERGE